MGKKWANAEENLSQHKWLIACLRTIYVAIAVIVLSTLQYPFFVQAASNDPVTLQLPEAAEHPLPPSLENWEDAGNMGDYFEHITPAGFGYLVWSQFPVKIYLETELSDRLHTTSDGNLKNFVEVTISAIQEWNQFIPLILSDKEEEADIIISAQTPALQWRSEHNDNSDDRLSPTLPRARTAETSYRLYLAENENQQTVVNQQYTILVSPSQPLAHLEATVRHELGHALGIWGHSPIPDDSLYFAQVRHPSPISARDINTLKKIYQQPTQLGWPLTVSGNALMKKGCKFLPSINETFPPCSREDGGMRPNFVQ